MTETKTATQVAQQDLIAVAPSNLATRQASAVASPVARQNAAESFMLEAFQRGLSAEQIGQMMDLRDREDKRMAKQAYDRAFALFKGENIVINRGKSRTAGPLRNTSYAELRDWVDGVTGAMSRHGLSSSWKITRDEKDWLEVTCYLRHIDGHEESVSMGGPPDQADAKNPIQQRASTITYLERYTLKAITGLAEGGEDNDGDGAPTDDQKELEFLAFTDRMDLAKDKEELRKIHREGTKHYTDTKDVTGYRRFLAASTSRAATIEAKAE